MADLTDKEFGEFEANELQFYEKEIVGAYSAYWYYNILFTVLSIGATTTTSVAVSNTAAHLLNPVILAIISWVATVSTLIISSFGIKENKDKYDKLRDGLKAERAFLRACVGPYGLTQTQEPRRLFVVRVTQLYLGTNPSPPAPQTKGS